MKIGPTRIVYTALTTGIIVSVVALYGVASNLQQNIVQSRAEFRDDIVWYATQYRAELNVLIVALQNHLLGSNRSGAADIVERFDVFWSRLQSSGSGPLGRKYAQLANAPETVAEALSVLKKYESVVLALDKADRQEVQSLLARLARLHARFNAVALDALGAKNLDQDALHHHQDESASRILAFLGGVLVLGASLLILLRIEKAKVDSLSGNLERQLVELEAAQVELLRAERLAAIGQLTGTVSHELRNPLGTIYSSCISLRQRLANTDPGVTAVIDRIERSSDRCNRIVEELLDYTRTRELDLESVDVDTWLVNIVEEIELPEQVVVVCNLHSQSTVWLDKERMRQALVNLIDNALQSMTEATESGGPFQLTVSSEATDERLLIHVADTGQGVPEDKREKIFEPLFSTRTSGVGLGLPLVRQVMEQHGGGVRLQPQSTSGATLTLSLPLANSDAREPMTSPNTA